SSTKTVAAASLPALNRSQIASAVGSGVASMHLIGRKIDNSARSNCLCDASDAVAPMSPSNMFASLTCSSGTSNVRAIASSTNPSRKPIRENDMQQLSFRNRSPLAMEFFEKLVGFQNGEWLRLRSSFQNLERGFAQIAVTGRDAMKFWIADFCRREQRAINHYPTNL